MACIPPTLEGWVYIIPIHGPLDGPLYTWAQYTPTVTNISRWLKCTWYSEPFRLFNNSEYQIIPHSILNFISKVTKKDNNLLKADERKCHVFKVVLKADHISAKMKY